MAKLWHVEGWIPESTVPVSGFANNKNKENFSLYPVLPSKIHDARRHLKELFMWSIGMTCWLPWFFKLEGLQRNRLQLTELIISGLLVDVVHIMLCTREKGTDTWRAPHLQWQVQLSRIEKNPTHLVAPLELHETSLFSSEKHLHAKSISDEWNQGHSKMINECVTWLQLTIRWLCLDRLRWQAERWAPNKIKLKSRNRESSNSWKFNIESLKKQQHMGVLWGVQSWPERSCNKTGIYNKADMSSSLMSTQRCRYNNRTRYYKRSKCMNTAGLWLRWIALCEVKSMPSERQDKTTFKPILPELTAARLPDKVRTNRVETVTLVV